MVRQMNTQADASLCSFPRLARQPLSSVPPPLLLAPPSLPPSLPSYSLSPSSPTHSPCPPLPSPPALHTRHEIEQTARVSGDVALRGLCEGRTCSAGEAERREEEKKRRREEEKKRREEEK
eukprot:683734-Hanusia_phi.AAC.4